MDIDTTDELVKRIAPFDDNVYRTFLSFPKAADLIISDSDCLHGTWNKEFISAYDSSIL